MSSADRAKSAGQAAPAGALRDESVELPITSSSTLARGRVFDLVAEDVDLGEGGVVRREFLRHPGAVAILALDEDDRVLLLRQYRHPVSAFLWEVPAGLLDAPGESLLAAARRELAEEADLMAARWDVLADFATTPGGSDELVRIFLARDLTAVPEADRHQRTEEELGMRIEWVPLDEAVAGVLGGRIHNPSAVVGVLAADRARSDGWTPLRPVSARWLRPSPTPL